MLSLQCAAAKPPPLEVIADTNDARDYKKRIPDKKGRYRSNARPWSSTPARKVRGRNLEHGARPLRDRAPARDAQQIMLARRRLRPGRERLGAALRYPSRLCTASFDATTSRVGRWLEGAVRSYQTRRDARRVRP